jgi:predicted alpha/beta-hydrolase family hydrolase
MTAPSILWNGTRGPDRPALVLAHGAGAPMDSGFLEFFAERLAQSGVAIARFEFPYMAARRHGERRGPDRAPVLLETWREVIAAIDAEGISRRALFIGGKSMGGRIASMVADDEGVLGLVCLGYPFHPPGKPAQTRVTHLESLQTPALIVQGERDKLGSREEVAGYRLSRAINVHWLTDGDHSFKPRKSSGRTERQNWDEGAAAVAAFLRRVMNEVRAL